MIATVQTMWTFSAIFVVIDLLLLALITRADRGN